MKNPKFYRHAQTQHGDETVDLENIVLCKANLFLTTEGDTPIDEVKTNTLNEKQCGNEVDSEKFESVNNDSTIENNSTINSESTQSVWFFDIAEDYFAEKEKVRFQNSKIFFKKNQFKLNIFYDLLLDLFM